MEKKKRVKAEARVKVTLVVEFDYKTFESEDFYQISAFHAPDQLRIAASTLAAELGVKIQADMIERIPPFES